MEVSSLERTLTEIDHQRLTRLMARAKADPRLLPVLEATRRAAVVQRPGGAGQRARPTSSTMYSRVVLADTAGGAPAPFTVCYPDDAEPAQGFVSVLSPVGTSLLGLRVGDVATGEGHAGSRSRPGSRSMLFQPEASGDYTL